MFRCAKSATVFVSFFANLNRIKLQNTMKFAFSSNQRHAMEISSSLSFVSLSWTYSHTYTWTHTHTVGRQTEKQTIQILRTLLYCSGHRARNVYCSKDFFGIWIVDRGQSVCVSVRQWQRSFERAWRLYKDNEMEKSLFNPIFLCNFFRRNQHVPLLYFLATVSMLFRFFVFFRFFLLSCCTKRKA